MQWRPHLPGYRTGADAPSDHVLTASRHSLVTTSRHCKVAISAPRNQEFSKSFAESAIRSNQEPENPIAPEHAAVTREEDALGVLIWTRAPEWRPHISFGWDG